MKFVEGTSIALPDDFDLSQVPDSDEDEDKNKKDAGRSGTRKTDKKGVPGARDTAGASSLGARAAEGSEHESDSERELVMANDTASAPKPRTTQAARGRAGPQPAASAGNTKHASSKSVVLTSETDPAGQKVFSAVFQAIEFLGVGKDRFYKCRKSGDAIDGWVIANTRTARKAASTDESSSSSSRRSSRRLTSNSMGRRSSAHFEEHSHLQEDRHPQEGHLQEDCRPQEDHLDEEVDLLTEMRRSMDDTAEYTAADDPHTTQHAANLDANLDVNPSNGDDDGAASSSASASDTEVDSSQNAYHKCVCKTKNWKAVLLCDGCDAEFCLCCVGLSKVPVEDQWFCPVCCLDGVPAMPGQRASHKTEALSGTTPVLAPSSPRSPLHPTPPPEASTSNSSIVPEQSTADASPVPEQEHTFATEALADINQDVAVGDGHPVTGLAPLPHEQPNASSPPTHSQQFLPFSKALLYARSLDLQSQARWREWCKSGARPTNIPANPDRAYPHDGWQGFGHWLGTNIVQAEATESSGVHDGAGVSASNLKVVVMLAPDSAPVAGDEADSNSAQTTAAPSNSSASSTLESPVANASKRVMASSDNSAGSTLESPVANASKRSMRRSPRHGSEAPEPEPEPDKRPKSATKTHQPNPKSQYRGVSWSRANAQWQARICHRGSQQLLGYSKDEREAARLFDAEAARLQKYNKLNFPLPAGVTERTVAVCKCHRAKCKQCMNCVVLHCTCTHRKGKGKMPADVKRTEANAARASPGCPFPGMLDGKTMSPVPCNTGSNDGVGPQEVVRTPPSPRPGMLDGRTMLLVSKYTLYHRSPSSKWRPKKRVVRCVLYPSTPRC